MDVFVIGASGLVGQNIVAYCRTHGLNVTGTHLSTETETATVRLDKTNGERTTELIAETDPDVVIDTAAFLDVDACESQRETAWRVNATGTRNAASAANAVDAQFVYLSTDYVFPGKSGEPSVETDPVSPVSYYGASKYAGEQAAKVADRTTILRGSVVYGLAADNFLTWALGELETGEEIGIVDDQVSTPTYAPDLARASVAVAQRETTGLYHAAGPESLSRYEFTTTLAGCFGYDPALVTPITTAELGQDAPRPSDSSLNSSKLYTAIDYEFSPPETAFTRMQDA